MILTAITPENIEGFRSLLLPEAADLITKGVRTPALGLVDDEGMEPVAIGAIAAKNIAGVMEVISFYVAPAYRKSGGGRMLLDALKEAAEKLFLGIRFDFVKTGDDHTLLEEFLDAEGFLPADVADPVLLIKISEAKEKNIGGERVKTTPFSELSDRERKRLEQEAKKSLLPLPAEGFFSKEIEENCSLVIEKNGLLNGYAIVERLEENLLLLSGFYAKNALVLPSLLSDFYAAMQKNCGKDDVLMIQGVTEQSIKVMEYFFGEAEDVRRVYEWYAADEVTMRFDINAA